MRIRHAIFARILTTVMALMVAVLFLGAHSAAEAEAHDSGTQTRPSSVHAMYETTSDDQRTFGLPPFQTEIWYRADGSERVSDLYHRTNSRTQVIYKNGHLVSDTGRATVWPISQQQVAPSLLGEPGPHLFGTVESVIKALGGGAHIAKEEEILGRKCDVVEQIKDGVTFRVSIDRSTGLVARNCLTLASMDTHLVALEVDLPIDDKIFESVTPSGTPVYKAALSTDGNIQGTFEDHLSVGLGKLRPAIGARDDLRDIIREDKGQRRPSRLDVIYWPSYTPLRFRLLKAKRMPVEIFKKFRGTVLRNYKTVETDYADPKTGDTIIFIQSTTKWPVSGEQSVKIGSFAGSLASGTDPFPFNILSWQRNGAYFTLAAANVQQPELVKIAQSLQAVPR
jgi:hypothetical protein